MIREAKRLHGEGFAVHWLKPKSKAPIESKWTTGDRKDLDDLLDQYMSGMNLGTRLGSVTKIGKGYLAVIDCDVKSTDPEHLKEMESRLREIVGESAASSPIVLSGRGNGSRHVYIRTREPVKPRRLAQSSKKVRVSMPSVKASKHELEVLKTSDIEKGIRLRPAWEISLMGDGQQVVLPPSKHPDTGREYKWKKAPARAGNIPLIELNLDTSASDGDNSVDVVDKSDRGPIRFNEVDLKKTGLSKQTIALIQTGEGCEDRSAGLFIAATEMVKLGMNRNDILSVLTDDVYYLGEAGFEHAKTTKRSRAARWVDRYTLQKVEKEFAAEKLFEEANDIEEIPLDEETAREQEAELVDQDWEAKLERTSAQDGARPKVTLKNLLLILRNAVGEELFKKDEFAGAEVYGMDTDWGGVEGEELRDIDILRLKRWLTKEWRMEPNKNILEEVVSLMASDHRFHPVRDHLRALPEWDGKKRVDTWLRDYMGATAPDRYLRAISRKTLCALVKRVMEPGCKFDHVLILEGHQGKGKSTALRILTEPWFTDAHFNIKDKDAVVNMRSIWCVEIGELGAMSHADVNMWKQFVTRQTDRIRMPFGKRAENFPRQCVFIGTTNDKEYLKDTTGNRRFWPVRVDACDFDALKRDRDQLFAEALIYYDLGETLYLEGEEIQLAVQEQADRSFVDVWGTMMERFIEKNKEFPREFPLERVFADDGPLAGTRPDRASQMRAADALRMIGYEKHKKRVEGSTPRWLWKHKDA